MFLWVLEASSFDIFYLIHGIFFDLSPNELFLKEIENDKVKTPKIISPRQINIVMRI
jgi:hypothetical protein